MASHPSALQGTTPLALAVGWQHAVPHEVAGALHILVIYPRCFELFKYPSPRAWQLYKDIVFVLALAMMPLPMLGTSTPFRPLLMPLSAFSLGTRLVSLHARGVECGRRAIHLLLGRQ